MKCNTSYWTLCRTYNCLLITLMLGIFSLGCMQTKTAPKTSETLVVHESALTVSERFASSIWGDKECKSEDEWLLEASEACAQAGAELTQYSVGGSCGAGYYQAVKFECCPSDEETEDVDDVCCRTVNGYQLIASDECPEPQITLMDFCSESGEVCCDTPDGAQLVDVNSCAPGWVLGMEQCEAAENEYCCNTDNGPQWSEDPCSVNAALPVSYCEGGDEETICCKTFAGADNGNATLTVLSECQGDDEQLVEMDFCTQTVCCSSADGPVSVPYSECTLIGLIGLGACEGDPVDDTEVDQDEANDDNDTENDEEQEEAIGCCQIYAGPATGNAVYATPTECDALSGNPASDNYCEQLVCCTLDQGTFEVPFHQCTFLALSGFVGIYECEAPEPTCCAVDGEYTMSDELNCSDSDVVDMAFCEEGSCNDVVLTSEDGCQALNVWTIEANDYCKLNYATIATAIVMGPACDEGGFASVTFECCVDEEEEESTDDEETEIEETCCYVGIGEFEVIPADDCNVGHDVDMAFCSEGTCDEVVLGNPGLCFEPSDWEGIAIKHCWQNFGTTNVSNQVVGAPCNGGFSITTFECCPEEEEEVIEDICCMTKGGPDVVPADECYEGGEMPMAACEQYDAIQEVCCMMNGEPTLTTANMCGDNQILSMIQCLELEEDKDKGGGAGKVPAKK